MAENSKFDGQLIQYVPHGFQHSFEALGWIAEPHILDGTHHGDHAVAMRWAGEGPPAFPTDWQRRSFEARVAAITNEGEQFYIMLGLGNHDCVKFGLTVSLARKLRRELNERLD